MTDNVLFLTLRTFNITGGIEKVCRTVMKVLDDLYWQHKISVKVFSAYDSTEELDKKFISTECFRGFGGYLFNFILSSFFVGIRSRKVIISHINLLPTVWLIKYISPRTDILVFAHGIEVWRPLSNWKKKFLSKYCHILAVSEFTARELAEKHRIPAANITILNNSLDPYFAIPDDFSKPGHLLIRYGLTPRQPVLFTLTRLSGSELYKGYDHVINCMPELLKSYPDMVYLLAGKADDDEHRRLVSLINKKGLQSHIKMVGFIPESEISDHFRLADVFVMPSKKEGFGIVFIEASACGCQVIGGNQDGSEDALLNGQLGTLINPDSQMELKESIADLLRHRDDQAQAQLIQTLCLTYFHYGIYFDKISDIILDKNPLRS